MIKTAKTRYMNNFSFYENDDTIGKSLEVYGEYAQREIDFLCSVINKNCTVWDIGSNIGTHAVAFALAAKLVYCFEPNKNNFKLLLKNTEHLDNVVAINAAVTNKNEITMVQDFDPKIKNNYGCVKVGEGTQTALGLHLDTWNIEKPDIIKIDVEGFEYQVLQGCVNFIKKYNPIIYFEAHETPDLPEIYDYLKALHYDLYWCLCPNFNENNFNKIEYDVFSHTGTFSILSIPKICNIACPLDIVIDRDDTANNCLERINLRRLRSNNELP